MFLSFLIALATCSILPLLLLLLLLFLFIYAFVRKQKQKQKQKRLLLPPSPKALPIIGHLHLLDKKNPPRSLHNLSNKYGPIMHLRFGFVTNIIVSSPDAAEQFLKTHDLAFASRPPLLSANYMFYEQKDLSFSKYGLYWRNMRKLCTLQLLSNLRIKSFRSMRNQELRLFVKSIKEESVASVFDLSAGIASLSANMSCLMVFGKKYSDEEFSDRGFQDVIREVMHLLGAPHLGDYFPFLPLLLLDPQGLTSRMKKVSKIFDKFLDTIIDEHQKFEHHPSDSDDFVSTMLSLMRSGDIDFEFDHRHVKGVLDMVVKESFRLHPPAPLLLPHAAIQDCTVEGYHIPKESRIIINAWSIGRDPNTWTNPEEFVPERFNHGNNNNNNNVSSKIDVWGKNFELIPFGSGRRGCPGMQLGFLAVRLIVAQLAHCFNWKLPEGMLPEELLASSSMAAFLCFLLLSSFQTLSAQQRQFNISLGSSLSPQGPNSSWLSASGIFAFGFYRQGDNGYAVGVFIAGIQEQTAVWTANRDNSRVVASENSTTLQLTTDGKLLLLGQQQNKSVLGLSNPSDSIATASMLDSGNFVLYNSVHNIIWQSFDYATNSLLPGQSLLAGKEQELISSASGTDDSKGTFLLKMQKDGYLVQYPVGTPYSIPYAYWQPLNAPGLGEASSLSLDNDGRLYLSNSTFTHVIFPGGDSRTVKLHLAKVDVDGIFRLYSHSINQGSWTKEWEALSDECAPKGICGFNSYCIRQGNGAVCECLPGFAFLNETNKKLGCVRNSTIEICKQENGRAATEYDFRPSENIAWVASPYAVSIKSTRAECQDACQDDCNCQVVFFDGRNCY